MPDGSQAWDRRSAWHPNTGFGVRALRAPLDASHSLCLHVVSCGRSRRVMEEEEDDDYYDDGYYDADSEGTAWHG